jgi:nitrogen fixation/metabolism regulation signal transduction histidine kinase
MRVFSKWLFSRSVHTKIAATIILVVAFFGIFVSIVNFYTVKTQTDKIVSEFVELNLKSNEDFVVKSVLAKDYWGVYRFLKSLSGNGFIEDIGFVDEFGVVVAHTDTSRYKTGDKYTPKTARESIAKIELKSSAAPLGYFVVRYKKEFAQKLLVAPMLFNAILFVFAALISIVLGSLISKRILKRLSLLAENAKAVTEKRWDDIHTLQFKEKDEITQLVDNMAIMMDEIRLAIKSEEDLKEFYHDILSSLDLFVLILNEELEVVYENGHPISKWALNGDGQKLDEEIKTKIKECLGSTESSIPCSSQMQSENGTKTLLINSRKIGGYYIASFADVTKVQELEKHIGLSRSLSLVGEISASFTHEIKNLLQPAKLLLGDIDKADKDDLKMVASIVSKIDRKVLDFLSIGRPIDKAMSVTISCLEAIDKTLFILAMRLEEKNINLLLDADDKVCVFMSENSFESIMMDMLSNAIEASFKDGSINVTVSSQSNQMTLISIEDNGVGIEEDIKEKIFEPFFTTKEKGSGLGLFGVYRTVYLYGGFIELQSKPGRTKFDIYLPSGSSE